MAGSVGVTTPTYRQFTATATVGMGRTPLFSEAAPGRSLRFDASVDLRPTSALRATLQLSRLTLDRRRDGSRFSSETIPRLKVEYQVNRALFLRFVGQYAARSRSALVDREGRPILIGGVPVARRTTSCETLALQLRPAGTLVYIGYGRHWREEAAVRGAASAGVNDGVFGKVSSCSHVDGGRGRRGTGRRTPRQADQHQEGRCSDWATDPHPSVVSVLLSCGGHRGLRSAAERRVNRYGLANSGRHRAVGMAAVPNVFIAAGRSSRRREPVKGKRCPETDQFKARLGQAARYDGVAGRRQGPGSQIGAVAGDAAHEGAGRPASGSGSASSEVGKAVLARGSGRRGRGGAITLKRRSNREA